MSLELEIKALREAVEALTLQLKTQTFTLNTVEVEHVAVEKPAPVVEPIEQAAEVQTNGIDRQALKTRCLTMIRNDRTLKDKIKELTASFGAKTVDALDDSKLADFEAELDKL